MKKFLLFTLLCLVIGGTASAKVTKTTKAKPKAEKVNAYKVEQANKAFVGQTPIAVSSSINDNTVIEIKENGYLMFVDNVAKKRYYVSRPCKTALKNLVTEVKKPKSVAKSFLESMMTKSKRLDYSSSGNVERKPTPVIIKNVELDDNGEMKVYMIE